jgi:hypothetical protein
MRIPGGVLGMLGLDVPSWADDVPGNEVLVRPHYTGGFAFELPSARVDMRVQILNLLLGNDCFIGTQAEPIRFNLVADLSTLRVISPGNPSDPLGQPFTIAATASDSTFSVPRATCSIWGWPMDWVAGLPSPSGNNQATFDSYIAIAPYAGTGTMRDPRTLSIR